jgi:hypothetical protein
VNRFVESYTLTGLFGSTEVFECEGCGGLVTDRARHDIFHRALRLTSGFNTGYKRSKEWLRIREGREA